MRDAPTPYPSTGAPTFQLFREWSISPFQIFSLAPEPQPFRDAWRDAADQNRGGVDVFEIGGPFRGDHGNSVARPGLSVPRSTVPATSGYVWTKRGTMITTFPSMPG